MCSERSLCVHEISFFLKSNYDHLGLCKMGLSLMVCHVEIDHLTYIQLWYSVTVCCRH